MSAAHVMRPRLLDLFCGAGGAAMGYHRAGFDVIGVDIEPQPRYPFEFLQADAMTFPLDGFDAIHASPALPGVHSLASTGHPVARDTLTCSPVRRSARSITGAPWVIENVPGAPDASRLPALRLHVRPAPAGMQLVRERWFETSWHGFELRAACHHTGARHHRRPATARTSVRSGTSSARDPTIAE